MKTLLLWVVLCTATPLLSQTKLSYTLSVTIANSQQNRKIIKENFGAAKKHKNTYVWEKYGSAYHYKIRLKPRKVIIRYTGKAKQIERKIKALRKRILH
jgi:hypothetical protein